MKNKKLNNVLYIILSLVLFSCGETHIHEVINRTKTIEIQTEVIVKKVQGNKNYQIIIIDGCEYIRYFKTKFTMDNGTGAAGGLCHKGNCKNH